MKPVTVSVLTVMVPILAVAAAGPSSAPASFQHIEVRVETLAHRAGGPVESCAVVQTQSANLSGPIVSWSTLSEGGATSPHEPAGRCGKGTHPREASASAGAPFVTLEVSVTVGWDAGAMDPGPLGAVKTFVSVAARQRTGYAQDGKPVYGTAVTQRRSTRLEPGEEYVLPVVLDAGAVEALGAQEVLLRVRAGWAGREGATQYGTVAVRDAGPGTEVVVDGGVAGVTGADGSLVLANIPEGQREVRLRGTKGPVVTRPVLVVRGRRVVVTPGGAANGTAARATLVAAGKNTEGYQEYRRERDGAVMVEIPEGEYEMGNLETEGSPLPHTVYVSRFLMDKVPLTVGRYERFAAATGRPLPPDPYWGVHEDHPVAFVRWDEAKAYCEWAGGRLPTEAEREKAARGTDGRMFPWGSEPPSPERAVFGRYWGEEGNDQVGVRPAGVSPYGMLDAEGNMWESCEDWWDPEYYKSSPNKDPMGPRTGVSRVYRGGSWDSRWVALSTSRRNFAYLGYREGDFGFRCAADPAR